MSLMYPDRLTGERGGGGGVGVGGGAVKNRRWRKRRRGGRKLCASLIQWAGLAACFAQTRRAGQSHKAQGERDGCV